MTGDVFNELPLFLGLSPEQLDALRAQFVEIDCYAGTVVFEQGEPADYLYLVKSGEVVIVYIPEDGGKIPIAHLHAGEVVGWSAAIGRKKYTSAAVCAENSRMLRVRGSDLQVLVEQQPELGELLLERMAELVAQRQPSAHLQVVTLLENGLRNGHHSEGGKNGYGRNPG